MGLTSYRSGLSEYTISTSSGSLVKSEYTQSNSDRRVWSTADGIGSHSISYNNQFAQNGSGRTVTGSTSMSSSMSGVYLSGAFGLYSYTNQYHAEDGTTDGTDNGTYSAGNTLISSVQYFLPYGTAAVITGYSVSSPSSYYVDTTAASYDSDYDSPSYIIVSTALTSGTGTDTSTYASTAYDSTSYTYRTVTYLTRAGTSYVGQTISYLRGAHHAVPVISAGDNEVLRLQTATGSAGVSAQDDIVGASFLQTTLSAAVFSGVSGTPYVGTNATRTITSSIISYGTITITVSEYTNISVTRQSFDGWVGGSETQMGYLYGATTSTRTQRTGVAATSTRTQVGGARAYTTHYLLQFTDIFYDTITGINSAGGSVVYAIATPYTTPVWASYVNYTGSPGETVTTKKSPSQPFGWGGGLAGADLSRIERAGGYQSPAHMGSTGDQGKSISAASSFFIGAYNTGVGSPEGLIAPFLTCGNTAETSNSVYSFSFGATDCSVTASRTESSISSVGTVTNSYTTATVTSFTVEISAAGVANSFQCIGLAAASVEGRTIAGGAHAWTGGQQHVTINGGYGRRYTLGDSAGTTSYKEIGTASIATANLGSSIIAVEAFKAGVPSPLLAAGLPNVLTFAYSET